VGRVGVRHWFAVEICGLSGARRCVVGFLVKVRGVLVGFLSLRSLSARFERAGAVSVVRCWEASM
jgi:hypothetical protein